MRVLDLFSGIGGFSLGLERAGMETIAFVEKDKAAQMVLRKHWKETPIFSDIKEFDRECVGSVDLICGGFPCQPFSTASHGVRTAIDLWPEMARVIWQFMPEYVIAENVSDKAIDKAKFDLQTLGYKCETRNITAAQCGADHKRSRWWLIAHTNNESELSSAINAEVAKLPQLCESLWGAENYARAIRVHDGVSNRMDRLKQLGNSVLPQIPQAIGIAIIKSQ
jgi:DNA (cytosine-5)-methyltransferase 1